MSTQQKIINYYKGLPTWGKGATIVGGGVILYLLYKKFLASPKPFQTTRIRTTQQVQDIGNNMPYVPYVPVLDYGSLADDMFDAMNGYGTYEDDIMDVIKTLNNQNDWNRLQQAYGTRTLSAGYGLGWTGIGSFKGSLKASLSNELSSYWMNQIKTELANRSINY
jgi:hypothetical protein